jgi:hypothetical protein
VDGYDEYQALLSIPVFQQGTAPYLTPDDGGGIDTRSRAPKRVHVDHGAGRRAAGGGLAARSCSHTVPVATSAATCATRLPVCWQPQPEFAVHWHRSGRARLAPWRRRWSRRQLVFQLLNPAATRGNPLQGAADQLSVARFAKALEPTPRPRPVRASKSTRTKLFFFGHSQGSTEGQSDAAVR